MLYLIALLCPPLACLMVGRFLQSLLAALLCLSILGIPLAIVQAWWVVKSNNEPSRNHQTVFVNNVR